MRLLVDTHILIWALDNPDRLSPTARGLLQDPTNPLILSLASAWEIAIKVGRGRLLLSLPYRQWINQGIADLGLQLLDIRLDHTERHSDLPLHHQDPFDRLLAAQALVEDLPLLSADAVFDLYGIRRLW